MNFIDSFCSNIKKVIALIALMLLLTLVILIFTHTSLGYFLVLLPITLLIIYLLHKIKKLDQENAFIYNSVLVILLFIFILFDLRKDIVLLGCFAYIIHLLMAYHLILKPSAITQQQEKNDIESDTINVTGSFITYADIYPTTARTTGLKAVLSGDRVLSKKRSVSTANGTSTKTARNGRKTKAAEPLNNLRRRSYTWASFFCAQKSGLTKVRPLINDWWRRGESNS